jgi:hypothetical protein
MVVYTLIYLSVYTSTSAPGLAQVSLLEARDLASKDDNGSLPLPRTQRSPPSRARHGTACAESVAIHDPLSKRKGHKKAKRIAQAALFELRLIRALDSASSEWYSGYSDPFAEVHWGETNFMRSSHHPHRCRDRVHLCHICAGTGAHVGAGTRTGCAGPRCSTPRSTLRGTRARR